VFNQVLKKKEEEERKAGVGPVKKIGMYFQALLQTLLVCTSSFWWIFSDS
jgi:hypothetical protein